MPTLAANNQVVLGPYPKGAVLTLNATQNVGLNQLPLLNTKVVTMVKGQPKNVTLAQGNTYTLAAQTVAITYSVH